MYSRIQWIGKFAPSVLMIAIGVAPLAAQMKEFPSVGFSFVEPGADAARDMLNSAKDLYENGKYADAEMKFAEIVKKYPKNAVADESGFLQIRSLGKLGRINDALAQIDVFMKAYPKSKWIHDVQEYRVTLTNDVSPQMMGLLVPPAPPAPPSPPSPRGAARAPLAPQAPTAPPTPAARAAAAADAGRQTPFGVGFGQGVGSGQGPFTVAGRAPRADENPELSFQREVLRVLFQNNPERAIEIANERLKANPSDPVVVSNLYMLAASKSDKALPMLITLAKTSPDSKVRQDAILFIGQSRMDKDALTDLLVGLVPSMTSDDDSSAISNALVQVNTPKAVAALSGLAADKSKSEKIRLNAIRGIAQSRNGNRSALLETIYKSSTDNVRVRRQVIQYLAQSKDPQDVNILAGVAANDPDFTVRREAVTYLGQINTPEAIKALENLLTRKP